MPWNGSGTYSLPPAYSPEVNGTTIDANRYNGLTNDVATGITQAIAKDGQNTPTANLPMGGLKHTGAGSATADGQYLVYGQTNADLGNLRVDAGTAGAPSLSINGDTDTGFFQVAANSLGLSTSGTEAWRWDSVGRQISGAVAAQTTRVSATDVVPYHQLNGTSLGSGSYGLFQWNATAASSSYALWARSRNATPGSHTIVQNGDALGRLSFAGSDGTQFVEAARIQVQVSGTPGSGDMPGSISFLTTPDGASSPVLVLLLDQDQSAAFSGAITSQGSARFNNSVYGTLGIRESSAYGGAGPATAADSFVIEASVNAGISILTPSANVAQIVIGDEVSNNVARWAYDHSTDVMSWRAGGTDKLFLTSDGRFYGNALHNNAGAVTGTTNQYIASGTWTPTLTAGTNTSALSSSQPGKWMRVGNVVTATCQVNVTITSASTLSAFTASLPIASDFANTLDAGGTVVHATTNPAAGYINANSTTDVVVANFVPNSSGATSAILHFTYEIK